MQRILWLTVKPEVGWRELSERRKMSGGLERSQTQKLS